MYVLRYLNHTTGKYEYTCYDYYDHASKDFNDLKKSNASDDIRLFIDMDASQKMMDDRLQVLQDRIKELKGS